MKMFFMVLNSQENYWTWH